MEIRQCLLSFGAESFVFQFAIQKYNIKIYTTTILPIVLYGCETWLLRLGKECRLKLFVNWVQTRILGPKRYEVTGEWRKLNNEELIDLYSSPNIICVIKLRRMKWAGQVGCMGERRGTYSGLVEKPE
jgi:hypothetical protein